MLLHKEHYLETETPNSATFLSRKVTFMLSALTALRQFSMTQKALFVGELWKQKVYKVLNCFPRITLIERLFFIFFSFASIFVISVIALPGLLGQ
jgi:hypothetical protein